jgi:hypothetical protein
MSRLIGLLDHCSALKDPREQWRVSPVAGEVTHTAAAITCPLDVLASPSERP